MRLLFLAILALLFFVLAALFASLNDQQVPLRYFWGQLQVSLPLLLLGVFLLGVLVASVFSLLWTWRLRWQNFRLKAQLIKKQRLANRASLSVNEKFPHG